MKKMILAGAIAVTAAIGIGAPAASADGHKPDTACMQAGIGVLQSIGALPGVAKDGLPIATAVGFGVAPREGTDLGAVPDPIPLKVVLADHRAGDNSLFIYPWCD